MQTEKTLRHVGAGKRPLTQPLPRKTRGEGYALPRPVTLAARFRRRRSPSPGFEGSSHCHFVRQALS